MSVLFGEGFLATILGWVIGFITGAVFAVISYSSTGPRSSCSVAVGYQLGVGFMALLTLTGFFSIVVGLIVGAIFAIGTIVLGVPKALVVVLTALGGAATVVAGALLVIGRIRSPIWTPGWSARSSTTTCSG